MRNKIVKKTISLAQEDYAFAIEDARKDCLRPSAEPNFSRYVQKLIIARRAMKKKAA